MSPARPMRGHRPGRLPGLAWLLLLAMAACGADQLPPPPEVVANVAGEPIPYERFEAYLGRNLGGVDIALPSEVLSRLFDQFLDEVLLARLAVDRELANPETPVRRAVSALLDAAQEGLEPTQEELTAYYAEHREGFTRQERVSLAQILVEDAATAQEAEQALAGGEDFAAVARRLSQDPAADRGGEQGELARGDLPPSFAEIIFALSPGQTSSIVEADYGFHIFKVLDRSPAEVLPLEEVEGEIRQILLRKAADAQMTLLVREARSRYNPVVYERNLPFAYAGRYLVAPTP